MAASAPASVRLQPELGTRSLDVTTLIPGPNVAVRRVTAMTSLPSAANRRTRARPMKPAAPNTTIGGMLRSCSESVFALAVYGHEAMLASARSKSCSVAPTFGLG